MKQAVIIAFLLTSIILTSCERTEDGAPSLFINKSPKETGISFQNLLKKSQDLNILNYIYYYNGAGVALADFNNDGLTDIYFTANQDSDKLYLNSGNLEFKDITHRSGIDNKDGWTTGVTTIDINNDGLMDIYVSKVGNHLDLKGHNLLYVNQGLNGDLPVFKEESTKYGLNISSYATQTAFLDYDLDGDLDMYLLNHSVSPNSNYGRGEKRKLIDSLSGDKFFENINGYYTDVSIDTGIFQGKIGYGLGLSIGDINNDGYPDIYVGNDFFENDYLYINQKDKTFKEIISNNSDFLGHTSHFSMGNALSDINNDGLLDVISLDMLPEDLHNYKTSGLEFSYPIYDSYLKNGYRPQYMQNTLHVNTGNGSLKEVAHLSGLAATEWSWSPLSADFDNDGLKDLYITNGIVGATNDMDFINFISNNEIQSQLGNSVTQEHMRFIEKLPSKHVVNYLFKNNGDNNFTDVTSTWTNTKPSYSSGAAYGDLDNDGDLDVVVNNTNGPAFILENRTNLTKASSNYLLIKFNGSKSNKNGIGTKIIIYLDGKTLTAENYVTQGFLSSVEPNLHFGLGYASKIDSISVIWPGNAYQSLKGVDVNQIISVNIEDASGDYPYPEQKERTLAQIDSIIGVDFVHDDKSSIEFYRDPLIPFASTNEGPEISVADINNDGLEDLFISGAKRQPSSLYIQQGDGSFISAQEELFMVDAINETTSHAFADFDNNGWVDLIVVSGGNEFKDGPPLQPIMYNNFEGNLVKSSSALPMINVNASKVLTTDLNDDNFADVIITSDAGQLTFGKTPRQYILISDGAGKLLDKTNELAADFLSIGNVKDASLQDLDGDKDLDLIVAGHWMSPKIFINDDGKLRLKEVPSLGKNNGWYNCIEAKDFDNDGDIDFVLGNWGLNSRLRATAKEPITLYNFDFDNNGKIDPIVTFFYKGVETVFASKEDLAKQMPFINKKYLSFSDFADATVEEIFGSDNLRQAEKKYVHELATCYFENLGDFNFKKVTMPSMAQVSSVFDIYSQDFNNDGYFDVLLTGNNFEISTQLSRLDASHGELFLFDEMEKSFTFMQENLFNIMGQVRSLAPITIKDSKYLVVGRNNATPIFLRIEKEKNEID